MARELTDPSRLAGLLDRVRAGLGQPWPIKRPEAAISPRLLQRRFREATVRADG